MTLMEPPILEYLIGSPSSVTMELDLRPKLDELMNLSYSGLMSKFAEDGFTDSDVTKLQGIVSSSLDDMELAKQLAASLAQVENMENEAEIEARLVEWLDTVNWETVWHQVTGAGFPDTLDALGYAACHVRNVATSTIWFENARLRASKEPQPAWSLDEAQINEGIALAEAGLAQEVLEWPAY